MQLQRGAPCTARAPVQLGCRIAMTRGGHLMCGGPRLDRSRGGPTWRRLDARRQRFSAFTLRVRGQRTLLCRHVPCSTSPAVRPLQHVPCSTSPAARPLRHVPCSTSPAARPLRYVPLRHVPWRRPASTTGERVRTLLCRHVPILRPSPRSLPARVPLLCAWTGSQPLPYMCGSGPVQ
jgi:hypothetical protein